jgi:hypothetical protein
MTSDFSATSLGEAAAVAPISMRSFIFDLVRFHMVRVKPALIRFLAMCFPMTPRPMKPILVKTHSLHRKHSYEEHGLKQ